MTKSPRASPSSRRCQQLLGFGYEMTEKLSKACHTHTRTHRVSLDLWEFHFHHLGPAGLAQVGEGAASLGGGPSLFSLPLLPLLLSLGPWHLLNKTRSVLEAAPWPGEGRGLRPGG